MRKLTEHIIDCIFRESVLPSQYYNALYRLAFPDWDEIETIEGYPMVNKKTGEYIMDKCIEWDDKSKYRASGSLPLSGGLWINRGFSIDLDNKRNIDDWFIDISGVKIKYKPYTSTHLTKRDYDKAIDDCLTTLHIYYDVKETTGVINDKGLYKVIAILQLLKTGLRPKNK